MRIDKKWKDRRVLAEGTMTFLDVQWYPPGHYGYPGEVIVMSDESPLAPVPKIIEFLRETADMLERCEAAKGEKAKKGKAKR